MKWIIQAVKDIYSFIYTEGGKVLALLKDPAGKYSHKRILALGFGLMAIYLVAHPRGWMDVMVASGFALAAAAVAIAAAATKT